MVAPRNKTNSVLSTSGLILSDENGDIAELSIPQLKQWFDFTTKAMETSLASFFETPELELDFLSEYGLQSPEKVMEFLKSDGGKVTLAMVGERLATLAQLEEEEALLNETERYEKQFLSLLLSQLYEKATEAKDTHPSTVLHPSSHKEEPHESISDIHPMHSPSHPSVDELETTLLSTQKELEALQTQQALIEKNRTSIGEKYAHYEHKLQEIDAFIATSTPSIADLEQEILRLHTQLQEEVTTSAAQVEPDDVARWQEARNKNNATSLEIGSLQDFKMIQSGTHGMYTVDAMPTTDFSKAAFILPKEKKMVKEGDQYYLLPADKNLNELSGEEKKAARDAYEETKMDIRSTKQAMRHHHQLEQDHQNEAHSDLEVKSDILLEEIRSLKNQIGQMQSARAEASLQMDKALNQQPSMTQGMPSTGPQVAKTMSPLPSTAVPSSSLRSRAAIGTASNQKALVKSYNTMLESMQNPNQRTIADLRRGTAGSPFLQRQLMTVRQGMPIPPALMSFFIRNHVGTLWNRMNHGNSMSNEMTGAELQPEPTAHSSAAPR